VSYSLTPGTAGADYVARTTGKATFKKGARTTSITVRLTPDTIDEPDEKFTVALSKPVRAKLGRVKRSTVTITDDDAPAPTGGGTTTPPPAPPAPPVPKVSVEDLTVDEAAGVATVAVVLDQASANAATVGYSTAASAEHPAASGVAGIPAGQTRGTFSIPLTNDNIDEDADTFDVTLSAPSGAEIADGTGVVTIADDDPVPAVSISGTTVIENNTVATLTLTLDRPSERAARPSVKFSTTDGTATGGISCGAPDFVSVTGLSVLFAAGQTTKTVNVSICEDSVSGEGAHSFTAQLTDPLNATIAGPGTATVTIADDGD
jgi:hypothetical protein